MVGMGAGRSLAGVDNALTKSKVKLSSRPLLQHLPMGGSWGQQFAPAFAAPMGQTVERDAPRPRAHAAAARPAKPIIPTNERLLFTKWQWGVQSADRNIRRPRHSYLVVGL